MKSLVFKFVRCACVIGALMAGLATQRSVVVAPGGAIRHAGRGREGFVTTAYRTEDANALEAIFRPELSGLCFS